MNIANQLTLLRIILVPVYIVLIYLGYPVWALGVFVVASLTDWLDGFLARKYHLVTNFGKFMDPLADKLLVTAALVLFTEQGLVPGWVTILILAREFAVTGLRVIASAEGKVIAASYFGKAKTVSQLVAIVVLLISMSLPTFDMLKGTASFDLIGTLGTWLIYLSALLTVISGIDYLVKNREFIHHNK